jgi:hypothetical protein
LLVKDGITLPKFAAPSDGNYRAGEDQNLRDHINLSVAKKDHARKYTTSFLSACNTNPKNLGINTSMMSQTHNIANSVGIVSPMQRREDLASLSPDMK